MPIRIPIVNFRGGPLPRSVVGRPDERIADLITRRAAEKRAVQERGQQREFEAGQAELERGSRRDIAELRGQIQQDLRRLGADLETEQLIPARTGAQRELIGARGEQQRQGVQLRGDIQGAMQAERLAQNAEQFRQRLGFDRKNARRDFGLRGIDIGNRLFETRRRLELESRALDIREEEARDPFGLGLVPGGVEPGAGVEGGVAPGTAPGGAPGGMPAPAAGGREGGGTEIRDALSRRLGVGGREVPVLQSDDPTGQLRSRLEERRRFSEISEDVQEMSDEEFEALLQNATPEEAERLRALRGGG